MEDSRLGDWDIRVFYDGDCPLCMREIDWLRSRTPEGRADFVDIADPSFNPSEIGLDHDTLMARIHGQLPDSTLIEGVEVFRRLYTAAGLERWVAPTRWRGVGALTEAAYKVFARNRLRITGRSGEPLPRAEDCDAEGGACQRPARAPGT